MTPAAKTKTAVLIVGAVLAAGATVVLIGSLSRLHRQSPLPQSVSVERREDWTAYGGTWEAVDGAMRNNSDERGAKLMTGSDSWQNYSVDADIQLLGQYGDAGLILRARNEEEGVDAYNGYFAGLRDLDNTMILGRADFGWREYVAKPIEPRVEAQQWYHLRFLAWNCDFVASVTSAAGVTTTTAVREANCHPSGRFGLKSYATGAMWRNVRVQPATHADEVAMIGPTPPPEAVPFLEVGGAQSDTADRYLEPLYLETKDHQSDPHAIPIDNLRLLSPIVPTQVTVHGVVTLTSPVLFIQDSSGGLEVLPDNTKMPLEIGDEVEAHGDLFPGNFSSVLKNASVHVLWSRVPVPPVSVTASQAASGNFDARFIETEGKLEQKQQGPDQSMIFTMSDGSQSFRAIVRGKGQNTFPGTIKEKSQLLLHGICVVDAAWTQNETPFAVILPSIDDIQVIKGPPWWSAGHIAAAVIVCFVLVVAVQALYGRIESMRLHAILEERERLAHEMHDTLAQSFAGIGFQLQAIRDEIGNEAELSEHLDLADALVRTSHEEARRSISALRSETLEKLGLFKALDKCAGMLVNGGSIRIRCITRGDPRTIPTRVSDNLFRIGQEAIANAVRHAQPTEIAISLVYAPGMLWLVIRDNGRGFPAGEDSASFGIRGMGERAERIGATLDIRSEAGQGTTVEVRAPLPARFIPETWQNLVMATWKRHPLNPR